MSPFRFLHIPKTAGTTMAVVLSTYIEGETFWVPPGQSGFEQLQAMSAESLNRYQFISGHYPFGLHEAMPGTAAYVVVDLGSTNGTMVNGTRISAEHRLSDGDIISFGATHVRFEAS